MADNPYAQLKKGNPYAVYKTAPQPKALTPPSGFAPAGQVAPVTALPGGPQDPRIIAQQEAARVGAAQAIQNSYEMRQIQAREAAQAAVQARNNQLPLGPKDKTDLATQMRKELEQRNSVQVYKNALPSYASALTAPDTPAGDQDMIYAYAKIMDPNSVVREGEANSVASLGTIGQQIVGNLRKQLDSSGKFPPELRTQLRNDLANRMGQYNKAYNTDRAFFRSNSKKQGIDPDLVLGPHLGDAYAAIENKYFRGDPNKSAAAARAEQAAGGNGGNGPAPLVLPGAGTATGATKAGQMSPDNAKLINTLIQSGLNADQVNKILVPMGITTGIDQETIDKARKTLAAGGSIAPQYEQPTTMWNRISGSPVGVGIGAAADSGAFGLSDEVAGMADWAAGKGSLSDMIALENAKKQGAFDAHSRAATIGSVVGGLTDMAGAGALSNAVRLPGMTRMFAGRIGQKALPFVGDALYGAAYGAGNNNDNRTVGAVAGGLAGGAGSVVGSKAVKAVGGAVGGVKNAAVDYLSSHGVPLTGGQILGGGWKSLEDKMTSIPLIGDMIKNRRAEGYNAFNESAFGQAGEPIGANITGTGDVALAQLRAAKSKAYSDALDPAAINMHDPSVVSDLSDVANQVATIPNVNSAQDAARTALDHRIVGGTDPSGIMSGRNFQEAYRGLSRTAKERANSDYGYEVGQAMESGKDALATALEAQNPGAYQAFLKANQANRNLNVLASALDAAKNQVDDSGRAIFTPAQLNSAASANTRMFGGKVASAINDKPFADLAKYGQQVLPSKVPDSGTAGRAAVGLLAATLGGGGTGGGAGYMAGDAGAGAGIGAGLALLAGGLSTKIGQKSLSKLLLERPDFARKVSDWVIDQAPAGGHFGATLGATYGSPAVTGWLAR